MRPLPKPSRVPTIANRARLAIAVGAAAVAVGVGLVAGESGSADGSKPKLSRPLDARFAVVRVPPTWVRLPEGNLIPLLFNLGSSSSRHTGAAGVQPPRARDAGVLIGRWPADGPDLLPGDFRRFATVEAPGRTVRLNGFEALSYTGIVSKNGQRRIELFLIPTTRSVLTIACYGPLHGSDGGAIKQCARIGETLRMTRGSAFPLGPRTGYRDLLNRVLGNLNTIQHRLDHALLRAKTAASQSAIAGGLAAAYGSAAAHLSHLPIGTLSPAEVGIHFLIRDSLRGVSRAWTALAAAARRRSNTEWRAAVRGVQSAVNTLGASLDELTKLGYAIS